MVHTWSPLDKGHLTFRLYKRTLSTGYDRHATMAAGKLLRAICDDAADWLKPTREEYRIAQ
jgi:hypothetical protein